MPMGLTDRRRFMVAATGSLMASTKLLHGGESMIPVIDTHQHLWDINKFKLPWLPADGVLARSYSIKDYKEQTAGLNVVNTVYMEVDVDPDQQLEEASFVNGLSGDPATGMKGAVVSGRPASESFGAHVEKLLKMPAVRGLRQVLHVPSTPPGYCLSDSFIRGLRLLGTKGLSFDLCVKNPELGNVAILLDSCPDTRFILDHCGNPDLKEKDQSAWKRGLDAVARRSNVVCKVSGFLASAPGRGQWNMDQVAPIINHTLEAFGPDRVMFAGDWPVVLLAASYAEWLGAVRQVVGNRPALDQKKLFHDNAIRHYRLKI